MRHLVLFLFFAFSLHLSAQTEVAPSKFVLAMEKQITLLDSAKTETDFQQAYNGFERISNAEKKEWLPKYYMAYCLVMQSYMNEPKKTDDFADKATTLLDAADSLSPNNAEIMVMRSLTAAARIRVNPMTRGAKFGKQSNEWLDKAEAIDPSNPRISLLRGQGLFYTPEAFGGGKAKAKPQLEEAVKRYSNFKPASSIHPHWGKAQTDKMLEECNK